RRCTWYSWWTPLHADVIRCYARPARCDRGGALRFLGGGSPNRRVTWAHASVIQAGRHSPTPQMDRIEDDRACAAARAGPARRARSAWRRIASCVLACMAALAALPVRAQPVQPLLMLEQGSHSAPVR